MRQVVACAVCAHKDWIDDSYPYYLWQEAPAVLQSTLNSPEESEASDAEGQMPHSFRYTGGPQLRDADGVTVWRLGYSAADASAAGAGRGAQRGGTRAELARLRDGAREALVQRLEAGRR